MKGRHVRPGKSVSARIPASSANLGPGFDVHSIALQLPQLEVELTLQPTGSRIITIEGTYRHETTSDPNFNAAGKALDNILSSFRKSDGYAVKIKAEIPPRKGLGLSGAESVGAVVCANHLLNLGLESRKLVELAVVAEPSHHLDNVCASALGGFNIATRHPISNQVNFLTLSPPKDLGVAVIVPNIEKRSTEATRHLIPPAIAKDVYVASMGYVSRISAAFATKDVCAIIETLPWDQVIESARADGGAYGDGITARFLDQEKRILLERHHVAETISGAGPSRALWFSIQEDARLRRRNHVGLINPAIEVVSQRLESLGHKVQRVFLTKPSTKGASINRKTEHD